MRNICTMTDKEAATIGNVAFRNKKGELYQSKKWRLHLFEHKTCEKIAIIEEIVPLLHIEDLWDKDERLYIDTSEPSHTPTPQYNWIEIDKNLVVKMYRKFDISNYLNENSQYQIFVHLFNMGFLGETIEPKEEESQDELWSKLWYEYFKDGILRTDKIEKLKQHFKIERI